MGHVKQILGSGVLTNRDKHNGRVFVDLRENVHFHYREFRIVFSAEEFLLFAGAITQGARNLEKELKKGYVESESNKGKIIGGSQSKNLNVENPTESAYFNNRFVIEEQANKDIDKFHIHYRDFRLVINNEETFLDFCYVVERAKKKWLESK